MDRITPEHRSWNMSRIRNRDTKPEKHLRSLLHREGFRFTVNGPRNRSLPGKPDIILPKYQIAVFVHGCFWHHHHECKYAYTPKTRKEWWREKFKKTRERDNKNESKIRELGWRVAVTWECELRTSESAEKSVKRLSSLILSNRE